MATARKQGFGRTLNEAFEDYARQRGSEKIAERGELSFQEGLAAFDAEWFDVQIAVRLQPHNQWVKEFRVEDAS